MAGQFRLSPQQERLWALGAGQTDSCFYAEAALRLSGRLNIEVLKQAIRQIVERYEILRTTYPPVPGLEVPLQSLADTAVFDWREHDLSAADEAARTSECDRLLATRPSFDLATGPVLRVDLATLATDEHWLILRLPSLAADMPSLGRLVEELLAAYGEGADNGTAEDDEILQFADLAEWQAELLKSEEMDDGRQFWRQQRLDRDLDARLPAARAGKAAADFALRRQVVHLDSERVEQLTTLATQHDATVDSLVLAAWQVYLARFAGNAQVVVDCGCDG
ncbi:MAG: condensation domain-containing protein, partial [Acidobacteriota bacterium]